MIQYTGRLSKICVIGSVRAYLFMKIKRIKAPYGNSVHIGSNCSRLRCCFVEEERADDG